ncbi:endothelin-converting enzyme homolog isoform X3 [Acanthaster planci]|uniref:Endothelin-converting enzyme homolog isoform X3 n=1 Tax=Acanthaster planci TaxID=133434 RepID=A0A8B7Y0G8_ACAPL|nr:endothelin-converting enzyme homolog isoform X3 [Acanthaster planci]
METDETENNNDQMVKYQRSSLSGGDELSDHDQATVAGLPNSQPAAPSSQPTLSGVVRAGNGGNLGRSTMGENNCTKVPDVHYKNSNSNNIKYVRGEMGGAAGKFGGRTLMEKILVVLCVVLLLLVLILAILYAIESQEEFCLTGPCVTIAGSVLSSMDKSVDPCEDFHRYSCGSWIKEHPIPDGQSRWTTFGMIWRENQVVLKQVLEGQLNTTSSAEKKAQNYYVSCVDKEGNVDRLGAQPLIDIINTLGGWNVTGTFNATGYNFSKVFQRMEALYDEKPFFTLMIGGDEKNSSINILQIVEGSILLPDGRYMVNKTEDDSTVAAYFKYMRRITELMGAEGEEVDRQLRNIWDIGVEIANLSLSLDDYENFEDLFNYMTVEEMQIQFPAFNWLEYLNYLFKDTDVQITSKEQIIVFTPKYLAAVSDLVLNTDPVALHNYMVWSLITSYTKYLSQDFQRAEDDLDKEMYGQTTEQPKWRSCITATDDNMGFALGALFVKETFQGKSKERASSMVEEIRSAFKNNLPGLDWMDEETRHAARDKANAILDLIGFPDYILNSKKLDESYGDLEINSTDYFGNNIRINQFHTRQELQELRKRVNRGQWEMTPPQVNAYYSPPKNEIVFPAGVLQAPFYDKDYPRSLNFGGMGVIMGHEITHGFDDSGRKYDKYGNLKQWWNNATIDRFKNQIQCMVDQYAKYDVDGNYIDGKMTLGENIADNGGLKSAYRAYQDWIKEHGEEKPLPALGLSHRQLFFVGFAQVWCSSQTPKEAQLQLITDNHSPARYRVIGTLSNSEDFAEQFNCPVGSPMNPKEKCEVW